MSKAEKFIVGLMFLIVVGIALLLFWRQSELKKTQQELDRKWNRNPFVEPATNSI